MLADLRYGTRILRRRPAITLVAAGSLAVGIGVGTGLFSVAGALFIRPLAVADPDRLAEVFTISPSGFWEPPSWPEVRDVAGQAPRAAEQAARADPPHRPDLRST